MYFMTYLDRAGEWRWRLRAANHEPIADSAEGYKQLSDCLHGINLIRLQVSALTPVLSV